MKKRSEQWWIVLSYNKLYCVRKDNALSTDTVLAGPITDYLEACELRDKLHTETLNP